jgi:hypothetical protein
MQVSVCRIPDTDASASKAASRQGQRNPDRLVIAHADAQRMELAPQVGVVGVWRSLVVTNHGDAGTVVDEREERVFGQGVRLGRTVGTARAYCQLD